MFALRGHCSFRGLGVKSTCIYPIWKIILALSKKTRKFDQIYKKKLLISITLNKYIIKIFFITNLIIFFGIIKVKKFLYNFS